MSFVSALAALGITGATNDLSQRFSYNPGKSSTAQRQLEGKSAIEWGVYADSQGAAKALAVVFGFTGKPEVHSSGMYGHYHGGYMKSGEYIHVFHIWYGGKITY
jgi:hypothetical protein